MTIADELRTVALLIDTLEDTYVSPYIFPEWVRRLRDIATRCAGLVSLAQVEDEVREVLWEVMHTYVTHAEVDERWEQIKARLKGGR